MTERLQKVMARAGLGSRRHNEELIKAGRVRVNGQPAQLGVSVDLERDTVEVDGVALKLQQLVYIMVNKPKGMLSDSEDDPRRGRPTVRDLVELEGHLYPVGRLDMDSEGLVLLTNDGDLAHRLTHPRYGHTKTYRVWVLGVPSADVLQRWRRGVELDDGPTAPCEVDFVSKEGPVSELRVVMREGRKRQIRRIAALLGHPVRRLQRTKLGALHLHNVPVGGWRHLTPEEVAALRHTLRAKRPTPADRTRGPKAAAGRPAPPAERSSNRRSVSRAPRGGRSGNR